MSDGEENADTRLRCEDEQQLDKEIHKLKYFLDETDEQWKKDVKARYSAFLVDKEKLGNRRGNGKKTI